MAKDEDDRLRMFRHLLAVWLSLNGGGDQNQGAFKWAKGHQRAVSVAFQDTFTGHFETFVSLLRPS